MFLAQCLYVFFVLQTSSFSCDAWDSDLELFDLVDEFSQNFYEFLSVKQDASLADIRKAYRRLSLTLHPDKNKEENAETQFRQLVAIYEVLKDDERRQKYNDILVNGLPDWRQPVFYYRRVRKMNNGELGFLLCLIMSVGHYAVIWSIYLEKQLDEFLSKKKREKKRKVVTKTAEETRCNGQDRSERSHEKPQWHDILPLKLSIGLYMFFKSLPRAMQELKQYYEFYQKMKIKEQEEAQLMAEFEAAQKEKRPKVKKPKFTFPVYEASGIDRPLLPPCGTSIEEIENQLEDWLDYKKPHKISEWTDEEISQLTRTMAKCPGGTPGRWEKIAHELGRSVTDVTSKVKQVKESVTNLSGLVKISELKGITVPVQTSLVGHRADDHTILHDDSWSQQLQAADVMASSSVTVVGKAQALRRRLTKRGGEHGDSKGRRQRDFDPKAVVDDSEDEKSTLSHQEQRDKTAAADSIWTQSQQKQLEVALQQYPRGTTERWDRIALMVPGKSKEECMVRYKLLAELVKKRKEAKS